MRILKILSNNSISMDLEIKKEQGFFSNLVSFSSILADYLFKSKSHFDYKEYRESYFFDFNENNINLINSILNNQKFINDFEKHLFSEFKINGKIDYISQDYEVFTLDNYIEKINIIIYFKEDVFTIPSVSNINQYVLNRYFYDFDSSKIFCKTDLFVVTNECFVFNSQITIDEPTTCIDLDKTSKFNNTNFFITYTPTKTIFEGNIHEYNKDLQWIK